MGKERKSEKAVRAVLNKQEESMLTKIKRHYGFQTEADVVKALITQQFNRMNLDA